MNTLLATLLAATTSLLFASTHALPPRTVYQFPNPTWLENIAAMRNGSLLVSVIGQGNVQIVNPLVTPATAALVVKLPLANAVLGITELDDNIFAVAAGNVTPANAPVIGSFSIWSIDLSNKHRSAKVSKIADTPNVSMINGLEKLDKHTLLLADSWTGNIAYLDTRTKQTGVWFKHASTASNFSAPGLPLGVNGIKVHGDYVYYTNTVQSSLNYVRVDRSTGKALGQVKTIAQGEAIAVPDDFAFLRDGSIVLGRPMGNEVVRVGKDGSVQVLAKAEGVTAVALGRTKKDEDVVYLSSMGGFNADGSVKDGGRVIAVEIK